MWFWDLKVLGLYVFEVIDLWLFMIIVFFDGNNKVK